MKTRETDLSANQANLERAVLTLRAIRQRYETGHSAHPYARSYSVHLAVDYGDMAWIMAAIDAMERALASSSASEAA
jgi:hypothetical protein